MTRAELAALLDHSVLKPESTEFDVRAGGEVVRTLGVAYYCVQPAWVSLAAALLDGAAAKVVAVIGFPHGCDEPAVKGQAARLAVAHGARELDMVVNLGALKSGRTQAVADDIAEVVRAVPGTPVKVILETAVLEEAEKGRREAPRLPSGMRCRCRIRQDVHRLSSRRRRNARRRAPAAGVRGDRHRRQGVRRHSYVAGRAGDDRCRRQSNRDVGDGADTCSAIAACGAPARRIR
jgi:hypothetical protein